MLEIEHRTLHTTYYNIICDLKDRIIYLYLMFYRFVIVDVDNEIDENNK